MDAYQALSTEEKQKLAASASESQMAATAVSMAPQSWQLFGTGCQPAGLTTPRINPTAPVPQPTARLASASKWLGTIAPKKRPHNGPFLLSAQRLPAHSLLSYFLDCKDIQIPSIQGAWPAGCMKACSCLAWCSSQAICFGTLSQTRNALDNRHPLQAFVFVVFAVYFVWFWAKG
jgi:hypothetical protein